MIQYIPLAAVCVRDPAQDQVVSEAIVSGAGWDAETVHTLARALNLHPGAVFIGDTWYLETSH